jgi:MATE family multidrug resistance protein
LADVKWPTLFTLVAHWGLSLPIGYLLAFELEMNEIGIWFGFVAGLSTVSVLLIARFLSISKHMKEDAVPTAP